MSSILLVLPEAISSGSFYAVASFIAHKVAIFSNTQTQNFTRGTKNLKDPQ
jgi:hypothetical protein